MAIHTLKLIDRYAAAKNTFVFVFQKPDNFHFKPGQYGGFTLIQPNETDASGNTRRFSLLSTPDDPFISFLTRIQNSAYKRVLMTLPIGCEIKFAGPTGNFILHDDPTIPAVFIAGGMGVSPFYSMITFATAHQLKQSLYLFYGNQSSGDTAFLNELLQLEKENTYFKFIPTFSNPEDNWQGETGFITHTMIKKFISNLNIPFYYVCGSPTMVTALQETLAEMGVDEERIKIEDFPGY